ncbi:MAG TPA: metalloregulator ArsR/SmtB family transcription factor [Thermoleophilaceae bacterium]|nr:metalloregulator ArsR/SmtB family transcription factor [Thermoleophilaceae bacterium]
MAAQDRCDLLCLDLPRAEAVRDRLLPSDRLTLAARRAGALGDRTRLSVAQALSDVDELCGCDLAWILGRAQNLVSHHLRALHEAGLVASRRDGRTVMYALTEEGRSLLGAVLGESLPVPGQAEALGEGTAR